MTTRKSSLFASLHLLSRTAKEVDKVLIAAFWEFLKDHHHSIPSNGQQFTRRGTLRFMPTVAELRELSG